MYSHVHRLATNGDTERKASWLVEVKCFTALSATQLQEGYLLAGSVSGLCRSHSPTSDMTGTSCCPFYCWYTCWPCAGISTCLNKPHAIPSLNFRQHASCMLIRPNPGRTPCCDSLIRRVDPTCKGETKNTVAPGHIQLVMVAFIQCPIPCIGVQSHYFPARSRCIKAELPNCFSMRLSIVYIAFFCLYLACEAASGAKSS